MKRLFVFFVAILFLFSCSTDENRIQDSAIILDNTEPETTINVIQKIKPLLMEMYEIDETTAFPVWIWFKNRYLFTQKFANEHLYEDEIWHIGDINIFDSTIIAYLTKERALQIIEFEDVVFIDYFDNTVEPESNTELFE